FAEVEHVGGRFTKFHHFPDAEATIYRCPRNDCEMKTYRAPFQSNWIKKTNLGERDDVLHGLLDAINHTPEPDFARMLEDTFDFTLTDPWVEREYLDNLRVTPNGGWTPVFSNLGTRIAFHPQLRERVLALIERGLEDVFRPDLLQPRFEAIQRMLAPYMAQDT